MSYFGAKYPEGISPDDYNEVESLKNISCPNLRRVALKALSSEETKYFGCDGCGDKDALVIVVDLETERMFLRNNSNCGRHKSLD